MGAVIDELFILFGQKFKNLNILNLSIYLQQLHGLNTMTRKILPFIVMIHLILWMTMIQMMTMRVILLIQYYKYKMMRMILMILSLMIIDFMMISFMKTDYRLNTHSISMQRILCCLFVELIIHTSILLIFISYFLFFLSFFLFSLSTKNIFY